MQRAQRATDNAALNAAIEAGNCLGKPVVVFFQLVPHSHHANLRHYQFLVEGLKDIATDLKKEEWDGSSAVIRNTVFCDFVARYGLVSLSATRIP